MESPLCALGALWVWLCLNTGPREASWASLWRPRTDRTWGVWDRAWLGVQNAHSTQAGQRPGCLAMCAAEPAVMWVGPTELTARCQPRAGWAPRRQALCEEPSTTKPWFSSLVHSCKTPSREVEAGRPEVQGRPWLCSKFKGQKIKKPAEWPGQPGRRGACELVVLSGSFIQSSWAPFRTCPSEPRAKSQVQAPH